MTAKRLLAVDGTINVQTGDRNAVIHAYANRIVFELPSLLVALTLLRQFHLLRMRRQLRELSRTLSLLGLRLTIRTPRLRLLSIGSRDDS